LGGAKWGSGQGSGTDAKKGKKAGGNRTHSRLNKWAYGESQEILKNGIVGGVSKKRGQEVGITAQKSIGDNQGKLTGNWER